MSGTTTIRVPSRTEEVYQVVAAAGYAGMTDPEVGKAMGVGHGVSSGALTRLHRTGRLARLAERRGNNQIYVPISEVHGRELAVPRAAKPSVSLSIAGEDASTVALLAAASEATALAEKHARRIAGLESLVVTLTHDKDDAVRAGTAVLDMAEAHAAKVKELEITLAHAWAQVDEMRLANAKAWSRGYKAGIETVEDIEDAEAVKSA